MKETVLRPNVCIIVYNSKRQILIGERLGEPETWQLPQGGVDPGTEIIENVFREVEEELGIKRSFLGTPKQLSQTHQYFFPKPKEYQEGVFSGQDQTFWLVEFFGKDSDISVETEEPEFTDWQWCEVSELLDKVQKRRVEGYKKIMPELEALLADK